jgi:hypothetical protein
LNPQTIPLNTPLICIYDLEKLVLKMVEQFVVRDMRHETVNLATMFKTALGFRGLKTMYGLLIVLV